MDEHRFNYVLTALTTVRDIAIVLAIVLLSSVLVRAVSQEGRLARVEQVTRHIPPEEVVQAIAQFDRRLRRLEIKVFNVPNLGIDMDAVKP